MVYLYPAWWINTIVKYNVATKMVRISINSTQITETMVESF